MGTFCKGRPVFLVTTSPKQPFPQTLLGCAPRQGPKPGQDPVQPADWRCPAGACAELPPGTWGGRRGQPGERKAAGGKRAKPWNYPDVVSVCACSVSSRQVGSNNTALVVASAAVKKRLGRRIPRRARPPSPGGPVRSPFSSAPSSGRERARGAGCRGRGPPPRGGPVRAGSGRRREGRGPRNAADSARRRRCQAGNDPCPATGRAPRSRGGGERAGGACRPAVRARGSRALEPRTHRGPSQRQADSARDSRAAASLLFLRSWPAAERRPAVVLP